MGLKRIGIGLLIFGLMIVQSSLNLPNWLLLLALGLGVKGKWMEVMILGLGFDLVAGGRLGLSSIGFLVTSGLAFWYGKRLSQASPIYWLGVIVISDVIFKLIVGEALNLIESAWLVMGAVLIWLVGQRWARQVKQLKLELN